MLYRLTLSDFPTVTRLYSVTRDTVWQITESEHILLFAKEGKCRIKTAGEEFLLQEGGVCVLPKDRAYERTPVDGTSATLIYLHFTLPTPVEEAQKKDATLELMEIKQKVDRKLLEGEAVDPGKVLFLGQCYGGEGEPLHRLTEGINLYSAGRSPICHLQASVALCTILATLAQRTARELLSAPLPDAGTRSVPPKLKKALGHLAAHPSEPVTPRDLARASNVSPQQLVRYFRDAFGTTPVRYITEFKISRAKELLFYRAGLSVKEVARDLGFDNQHYFSRVFTAVTGETPTAYRHRTWNYGKESPR